MSAEYLTIDQAEQRIGAQIKRDPRYFHLYANTGAGPVAFYEERRDGQTVVRPMCGDWPNDDLTDCPIPAEDDAADEAQRHTEQRGG